MTILLPDAPSVVPGGVLLGQRRPRIRALPPAVDTSGYEAAELLRETGQEPDDWQVDALCDLLGEGADGRWAARRTFTIVPRQNGKGGIIEPIELLALFTLHEVVLHSAHLFDTARAAFIRIKGLIEGTPDMIKRVKSVMEAHGKEGIYLKSRPAVFAGDGTLLNPGGDGGELRFHARTRGGGRGKSPHRLVLDEGFAVTMDQLAALLPSISAQDDPQVNIFSTPPPVGDPCPVLMEARKEVLERQAAGLPALVAYLEWGVPREADITKPETWAAANPAYGIRISEKGCRDELSALGAEEFGVERCGMWPPMEGEQWLVIKQGDWDAAADPGAELGRRPAFCIEMSLDREWVAIFAAWWRPDGLRQVELIDHRPGVGWLPERVRALKKARPCAWLVPRDSPASSEVAWMEKSPHRLEVQRIGAPEWVAGAGMFYDGIAGALPDLPGVPSPRTLRHSGQDLLGQAVGAGLPKAQEGKAWTWDPAAPGAYLVRGATGAVFGLATYGRRPRPPATAGPAPPAEAGRAAKEFAGAGRLGI